MVRAENLKYQAEELNEKNHEASGIGKSPLYQDHVTKSDQLTMN